MNMDVALAAVRRIYPSSLSITPWEVYADCTIFLVDLPNGATENCKISESDLVEKNI